MPTAPRRGFTLVEIMIVVAIIGLLSSIAVPSYLRSRRTAQANGCINNLLQVDGAKDRYGLENNLGTGTEVDMSDLAPYFVKGVVACPVGGVYEIKPIGEDPVCGYGGAHTI